MPAPPTSHQFRSQRLDLTYASWGNPEAPPLILVHGLRDHGRAWDPVAESFASDWHVIVPDLRGHGDSGWPSDGNYAMSGFVFDLSELIAHLQLETVDLVGHSLGGNISLRYAAAFPEHVRKLVVMEGIGAAPDVAENSEAVPISQRMRKWIETRRKALDRMPRTMGTLEEATTRYHKANPHLTVELADHLTRHGTRPVGDGLTWKFDPLLQAMAPEDFSQELKMAMMGDIEAPVLLIYGDDSWASNPANDGRMDRFRDVQLATFPNAGHWIHHDAPAAFVTRVSEFLDVP